MTSEKVESLLATARRYDALAASCDAAGNLAASIRATEGALQCREAARALLVYGEDSGTPDASGDAVEGNSR